MNLIDILLSTLLQLVFFDQDKVNYIIQNQQLE